MYSTAAEHNEKSWQTRHGVHWSPKVWTKCLSCLKLSRGIKTPTCCVWHPAVSSAQPCAVPPHPAEEQSCAPCARPLCTPNTWLSHMTRSRTPSPAEGDRASHSLAKKRKKWIWHSVPITPITAWNNTESNLGKVMTRVVYLKRASHLSFVVWAAERLPCSCSTDWFQHTAGLWPRALWVSLKDLMQYILIFSVEQGGISLFCYV